MLRQGMSCSAREGLSIYATSQNVRAQSDQNSAWHVLDIPGCKDLCAENKDSFQTAQIHRLV